MAMKMNERLFAVVLLSALATGCNRTNTQQVAEVDLPDPVVLQWAVSQGLWGEEVFEVQENGLAHYTFVPVTGHTLAPVDASTTLTEDQLEELREVLEDNDFCDIEAEREAGIPDEGRPTLSVDWESINCSVTLWDGDWSDISDADAVATAIRALVEHTTEHDDSP